MKKLCFLLCVIIIIFCGCSKSKESVENESMASEINDESAISDVNSNEPTNVSADYRFSENGELWNFFETLNQLVKQGEYYKEYSNNDYTGYRYEIYDYNGAFLDYGYYGWRGAQFEQNGDILKMRLLYGGNIGNEKYYDIKNGKVSRVFECVLDNSDSLIAYFDVSLTGSQQKKIVIEDMFDATEFHQEFPRDISTTSILNHYVLDAEFIDNNTKFKITYQTSDDKEITEILEW